MGHLRPGKPTQLQIAWSEADHSSVYTEMQFPWEITAVYRIDASFVKLCRIFTWWEKRGFCARSGVLCKGVGDYLSLSNGSVEFYLYLLPCISYMILYTAIKACWIMEIYHFLIAWDVVTVDRWMYAESIIKGASEYITTTCHLI